MKYFKLIIVIIFTFFYFSCEKYLDIKSESQQVFIKTSKDCQAVLDNYSVLNIDYPTDGEASAGDYYLTDASYLAPARTQEDRGIYTWQSTVARNLANTQWLPCYFKIYNTNLILEALNKLDDNPTQSTIDGIRGSALFYRSFSYWQLAQLYAAPYSLSSANTELGIPLRMSSDINEKSNRGTVKQLYDLIISDLREASLLLPLTSSIASRPSQAAAHAMLARVYLSMEDYTQAQISASAALNLKSDLIDYNTLNKTSITPFLRFNNEVIFHAVTIQSQLLVGGTTAINAAKIDPLLYASYSSNDLRKTIFFKPVVGTPNGFAFTGNYEPANNGTLFIGLTVDELYLIRAECSARTGNITQAMSDLNTLLRTRWITGSYVDMTANNSDDALIKILLERRKELLLRGLRWTDLRRLNKDPKFAITLTRNVQGTNYTLSPNDLRYTLLIPFEVIVNGGLTQNSR